MKELHFEWDNNKDLINQTKHGISFEEAASVFYDEQAVLFDDPDHSEQELRFLIIGLTYSARICIVSHCCRDDGNTIRIISARKATKKEQQTYIRYSSRRMTRHERRI